ncbi:MAG: hypothetical protein CO117_05925 [Flavobacteriaceae bacterium CG_4_9_14_3_um_filter_33_16]|nr:MAG: hypothetical protein CO117_05925 [Flavobacteriaceae bacterium CG_4_9_14_3_um_filter_33_16]
MVPDLNTKETLKAAKNHEWIHQDNFETIYVYKRFLNWVSGEFILFQQDENNGLKVLFPNGWFFIYVLNLKTNSIEFRIEVKSKCLNNGTQIFNQVLSILKHSKEFQFKT